MTNKINIEKLKIFNSYNGDEDGICRNNRLTEIEVFGDDLANNWSFINSKFQDIGLISKRLCSNEYTKNTLVELYENTDVETFKLFVDKIPFYNDFQKVRQLLESIRNLITDETDTVWAGYDNGKEFLVDLNADIEKIQFCEFETLDKLNMEFALASTYQEISLSSGWATEYLKLAVQFNKLYDRIKK